MTRKLKAPVEDTRKKRWKDKIEYVASNGEKVLANNASRIDMTMTAGGINLLFIYLLGCTIVERF